jgi:hypothetical protein
MNMNTMYNDVRDPSLIHPSWNVDWRLNRALDPNDAMTPSDENMTKICLTFHSRTVFIAMYCIATACEHVHENCTTVNLMAATQEQWRCRRVAAQGHQRWDHGTAATQALHCSPSLTLFFPTLELEHSKITGEIIAFFFWMSDYSVTYARQDRCIFNIAMSCATIACEAVHGNCTAVSWKAAGQEEWRCRRTTTQGYPCWDQKTAAAQVLHYSPLQQLSPVLEVNHNKITTQIIAFFFTLYEGEFRQAAVHDCMLLKGTDCICFSEGKDNNMVDDILMNNGNKIYGLDYMLTKSIHGYGRCVNVTVDGNKIQMYWYPLMEMAKLGHTCKIDSLPNSPSKKTGKTLAKFFQNPRANTNYRIQPGGSPNQSISDSAADSVHHPPVERGMGQKEKHTQNPKEQAAQNKTGQWTIWHYHTR